MESGICEVERIRAEIINDMKWSDYEDDDDDIYCCGIYNLFF